jgi:hypothetical protein
MWSKKTGEFSTKVRISLRLVKEAGGRERDVGLYSE